MTDKNQLASTYIPQSNYRNKTNKDLTKINIEISPIGDNYEHKIELKKRIISLINIIHKIIFSDESSSKKLENKIFNELFKKTKKEFPEDIDKLWDQIKTNICNLIKVHYLTYHVDIILNKFEEKLNFLVFKYKRYLPQHVSLVEGDDLKTIAQLELLETFKAWDPLKRDDLWPLAYTRINGAMKDHIRYISKSDPTRFYDWVTDAANLYLAVNNDNSYEEKIENSSELSRALKILSDKEKKIVIFYLNEDLTFNEISKRINLSESQISRIYKQAIKKIKTELS